MGKMRGIAATLVSVAVFVSLLISNLTLLYAENQRLWMASMTKLETDEGEIGMLLVAQGAYAILNNLQTELVQNPPSCSSWDAYSSSLASSSSHSGSIHAVQYGLEMAAAIVGSGSRRDNLTLLRPFDGYLPGSLNVGIRVHLNELSGGLPSYTRTEYHYLHLPISLSKMLSLCLSLLQDLHHVYQSRVYCNRLPSETPLDELFARYSQSASSNGFTLVLTHWFVRVDGCWLLSYAVTLSESSVEGVSGRFAWRLSDAGFP